MPLKMQTLQPASATTLLPGGTAHRDGHPEKSKEDRGPTALNSSRPFPFFRTAESVTSLSVGVQCTPEDDELRTSSETCLVSNSGNSTAAGDGVRYPLQGHTQLGLDLQTFHGYGRSDCRVFPVEQLSSLLFDSRRSTQCRPGKQAAAW